MSAKQDSSKRKAIFMRKLTALIFLSISPIAVALIRLLRPFIIVRFGPLFSGRIGHLAANTEIYMCERDAGLQDARAFDIFYHTTPICNQQLRKMWDAKLRVFDPAIWFDRLNRVFPGWQKYVVPLSSDRDVRNLLGSLPAHLEFSEEDKRRAEREKLKLGISENENFVCFHGRDPAYLSNYFPSEDWGYHNYRDCDISNFILAAEEMAQRGYFAIRMGALVSKKIETENPKVIDYAVNGRSELMDIYLPANCRFFICADTGLGAVAMIFRRPVVWVNVAPLERLITWNARDLIVPKKLWLKAEKRFLTFKETLESGIGGILDSAEFAKKGIEPIENSPEEIRDAAMEMDERLKGSWLSGAQDQSLQDRFWSFFKPGGLHGKIMARISAGFLRQNQELLR